jgi:hypothetical protein
MRFSSSGKTQKKTDSLSRPFYLSDLKLAGQIVEEFLHAV